MKINDLLSPGALSNGIKLRVEAAKAIGSVEVTAMRTPGGKFPGAGVLAAFFTDCASKLSALYEAVAPTISSRVAASATVVNITFSETMDQTVIPALSAFTSAGNTITAAAWTSATVLQITGTGFAAAENFTYTKPEVSYLRDLAGNAVATSSANLT
jgi:hypothetical protein